MTKYVIYGAGDYGCKVLAFLNSREVAFYIDRDPEKQKKLFHGYRVYSLEQALSNLKNQSIIIALSEDKIESVKEILAQSGIQNISSYDEIRIQKTREKLLKRTNYISVYNRCIGWIQNNTVKQEGIVNNSNEPRPYPEVTGYFIPSLIRWGKKELAKSYAEWLCSVQSHDGSWLDTEQKKPYVFDSAQILKGLVAARKLFDDTSRIDISIKKGCDWLISRMSKDGRLNAIDESIWEDGKTMSELIHLYCLSPLIDASHLFGNKDYEEYARSSLAYYMRVYPENIESFGLLSHFYAYVMEGLLDLGERDIVARSMDKVKQLQCKDGAVPAYQNSKWVCSTGLFQFSLIWYRLGDLDAADRAFSYACKLQNSSGGWYGGYFIDSDEVVTYFPDAEISWANKYFLDALYYRCLAHFNQQASSFKEIMPKTDERYTVIESIVKQAEIGTKKNIHVLDVGCGKGAYLNNLLVDHSECVYYGVDISCEVLKYVDSRVETRQGIMTDIPYEDNKFNVTFACEAIEHAIDVSAAIKEMARVTMPGGYIVVIDKNYDRMGEMVIEEWEQWFSEEYLREIMGSYCSSVTINKEIAYEKEDYGLFYAWIGKVR